VTTTMDQTEDETAGTVVIDTRHGPLRLPAGLLVLWNAHGWPADHVLREMAAEGRYRP
jgi:hypothetical protein